MPLRYEMCRQEVGGRDALCWMMVLPPGLQLGMVNFCGAVHGLGKQYSEANIKKYRCEKHVPNFSCQMAKDAAIILGCHE